MTGQTPQPLPPITNDTKALMASVLALQFAKSLKDSEAIGGNLSEEQLAVTAGTLASQAVNAIAQSGLVADKSAATLQKVGLGLNIATMFAGLFGKKR